MLFRPSFYPRLGFKSDTSLLLIRMMCTKDNRRLGLILSDSTFAICDKHQLSLKLNRNAGRLTNHSMRGTSPRTVIAQQTRKERCCVSLAGATGNVPDSLARSCTIGLFVRVVNQCVRRDGIGRDLDRSVITCIALRYGIE